MYLFSEKFLRNLRLRGLLLSSRGGGVWFDDDAGAPYATPVPTPPNSFFTFGGDMDDAAMLESGRFAGEVQRRKIVWRAPICCSS